MTAKLDNGSINKEKYSTGQSHLWINQIRSVAQSCLTLCDPMNLSTPGLPVHHQLLEFTQTHVHRVSDAIQPSHPLSSLPLLPPIPPSIRVFSNESTLRMRWPKHWSFSFSISPSKEIPGLISWDFWIWKAWHLINQSHLPFMAKLTVTVWIPDTWLLWF